MCAIINSIHHSLSHYNEYSVSSTSCSWNKVCSWHAIEQFLHVFANLLQLVTFFSVCPPWYRSHCTVCSSRSVLWPTARKPIAAIYSLWLVCVCCPPVTATPLNFCLGRVLPACLIVPINVSWAQHHRLVIRHGCNSFKGTMYFYGAHESLLVPVGLPEQKFLGPLRTILINKHSCGMLTGLWLLSYNLGPILWRISQCRPNDICTFIVATCCQLSSTKVDALSSAEVDSRPTYDGWCLADDKPVYHA